LKLKLKRHRQFLKDLRKVRMTDSQFQRYVEYLNLLINKKRLPPEAKDHELQGHWKGFREFHLGGDLLIIYKKRDQDLVLARIGTHNRLFK